MKHSIAILMLLALAGCAEPSSTIEFTQCVRPLDYPDEGRLLREESRHCKALQWRMPRRLFSRKWDAYGSASEAFIMQLPSRTGEMYQPSGEIMLMPILGKPVEVLEEDIATATSTFGLAEHRNPSPGLRMLRGQTGKAGDIEVLLVAEPGKGARYKALCFVPRRMGRSVERRLTCDVRSVVNEGAYVKYTVPLARIEELPQIHRSVVDQLAAYTNNR